MKNANYERLTQLASHLVRGSDNLIRIYEEFEYENMQYLWLEMGELESEADSIIHEIKKSLTSGFLLPVNRMDIIALAEGLDAVLDKMEDIAKSFYMFNIKEFRKDTKKFLKIIAKSTSTIEKLIKKLNKKNIKDLSPYIEELYKLEDAADALYIKSTRELFKEVEDPIVLMQWEEIIYHMESCCDKTKAVADVVLKTYLKGS